MANRRELQRGEQRTRILSAAWTLFTTRGFDAVTMSAVADEAHVARATVFNHFGTKRALLEAITQEVLAHYGVMLDNALANDGTPVPALIRALFEQMGTGIEEDRRFYREVFREILRHKLGLDDGGPGERFSRAALGRLVELFRRGQTRGEISDAHRAEDLASAFDSLVNGTLTHWLYDDASESLRVRMRRAADVFLAPIAIERGTARRRLPALTPRRRRSFA